MFLALIFLVFRPHRARRSWGMGKGLVAPIVVIGVVLGSIYGGITGITEAAGMGVVAVFLISVFRGEASFDLVWDSLMRTLKSTGTIIWVTLGAAALAGAYTIAGGPTYVANMILAADLPTMGILLMMMLILLFMGAFMDWVGIVLLIIPVFLPIVRALPIEEIGILGTLEPKNVAVWFGVLFCMNMQVSFLSPPFGPAAFYLKSVAPPQISLTDIFRGFLPFICIQLCALSVLLIWPRSSRCYWSEARGRPAPIRDPTMTDTVRLSAIDNVVTATRALEAGHPVEGTATTGLTPSGHKIATRPIAAGEPVMKYAQRIGLASRDIAPGDHVHTHNLAFRPTDHAYEFATDLRPAPKAEAETRSWATAGPTGRSAPATTSHRHQCELLRHGGAAHRGRLRARGAGRLPERRWGRGLRARHGLRHGRRRRRVRGAATGHVGLCEAPQPHRRPDGRAGLRDEPDRTAAGGLRAQTIRNVPGHEHPERRRPAPHDRAGGREGPRHAAARERGAARTLPGVSAEGRAAMRRLGRLVGHHRQSGAGPCLRPARRAGRHRRAGRDAEIYGAEHLLTRRAVDESVGAKLVGLIDWWEDYTRRNKGSMDNNPSPGNKKGGLTTILEKSLGAAAKGGTTPLTGVYKYAEPVRAPGFTFMDSPGYDPASVTGQIAGGCNLVCFTTGRGSAFGSKPAPTIKVATNDELFRRMSEDMDIGCRRHPGRHRHGGEEGPRDLRDLPARRLGRAYQVEAQGLGDHEFVPWQIGAVM